MRFSGNEFLLFMWIDHIFLGNEFGYKCACGLPLLLELFTTLWCSGINTKHEPGFLITLCEGVKGLVGIVEVATISEPSGLGDLIVKEARGGSLAPLLKSEPVENVGLESLTGELHGRPLTVQIVHGVVPSLTRVGIKLPTVSLLSGGPVGYLESLEHGSWSSVECNITNSLKKGIWVEILCEDVMLDVWLLVEFVTIEILDSNTYIILN